MLLGQLHRQIEPLRVLRVGGDHSGEIAVDDHLLGHADHVLHAQALEGLGDQLIAGAVEGGVHHGEGVRHLLHHRLVVHLLHHVGQELLVRLRPHQRDPALGHGLVIVHGLDAVEHVQLLHLPGHLVGVLGGQLGTVLPVDLVAVVLLGVVTGGDVDTGDAAVLPHREGQLRGGTQGLEQAHGDAVARHDTGGLPGKDVGVVAAVEADGHPPGGGLGPLLQDDLGKGLGGVADDMDIHPVQPHPHGAPQACGAEGKLIKKAGFDLLVIALDGCQLCLLGGREGRAVQPCMISIKIGHIVGPPINKIRWDMLLWTLYHRQA